MNNTFNNVLIIGLGLIGSSIARAIKNKNISKKLYGIDKNQDVLLKCKELDILLDSKEDIADFEMQFDLIIICSPLGTYKEIFIALDSFVKKTTIVTDVGSTKISVIEDFKKSCKNEKIFFIPGHPIAGIEKSGPEFGFAELFENRYCILTPFDKSNDQFNKIKVFWETLGMKVEKLDANYHDRVLAMTSHLPQLIAYSIVFTANELEENLKNEVFKYSAGGFRDFTRLAGSDPIMWRDIYGMNKEAVIEMLGRFTEDLSTLQKAIRKNDLAFLEKTFLSTKQIRMYIEKLGQAGTFDPTESNKKK